ncbi:hypothetical protein ASPZODRAFT_127880 [Penicilliopsis zonata CBS 506.65]|uniref:Response regulatory domain-containing protein n=1 Tax=Penicilliopsis zonata CBS 506.65 TaxID=1073090 RepID=A0A1L9SXD0_9EURO|nr:hypothetical protein ASPZODRAFT_127880 [Penicilliopsis zonata CBS 506.65]OJJ51751.1 hypothetical protein ASPZODRAFT_127880 [Penicilliopsis zonata CBS 506.65]
MDVSMPVMDGYTAVQIIRTQLPFSANPRLQTTPIITMIAHKIPEYRMRQGWIQDTIGKPVRVSHMKQTLLRWSRKEIIPIPGSQTAVAHPAWGPHPLRAHRGPRSLL